MLVLTFTAPTRPLSINESSSMHWAARRRRLRPWHDCTIAAYRHTDAAERERLTGQRIRVHVIIPFARNGRRDPHNYSSTVLKTIVDALITAGLAPDDTPEFIETTEPKLRVDSEGTVVVYLEPIGAVEDWTGDTDGGDLW